MAMSTGVIKTKHLIGVAKISLAMFFIPTLGMAQLDSIIGPDGKPLPLKRGMTIAQAIDALRPEHQSYVLSGDYGWFLQIHESGYPHDVLMSLWSDENQDYLINYSAKLETIVIHSPKYRTKSGIYVGMLLSDAEKKLGKLKYIYTAEPAFAQYAVFETNPDGVALVVSGGIFKEGERRTKRYSPGAYIMMIEAAAW
jgi:hypothetical protein